MRLRGAYLLLAVAASVSALFVLAGPAAAANLSCGQVITSSTTLIGNLDCSATGTWALRFDAAHPGVTLNLNGFWVKGAAGHHVINTDGASGITIKNGTLYVLGDGIGVDNDNGGYNVTLDVVNIVGDNTAESIGVDSEYADNLSVIDGSISGVDYGLYLYNDIGDVIRHNSIETCATGTCDESYGVYSEANNTGVQIVGNAFTSDAAQTGTAYSANYDAGTVFSGNTVTALQYGVFDNEYSAGLMITSNVFGGAAPADGLDYGVYLTQYGSGDVISGNFIRNSFDEGVYDGYSYNDTYVGNIGTADGRSTDNYTFDIFNDGYGPVTMVNNVARLGFSTGIHVYHAYNDSVPGGPYSLFSGNSAIADGTDGGPGFSDEYSVGATWTGNVAKYNATDGFWFNSPWRETVSGNTASLNGGDGMYFLNASEKMQPTAVANNSATYNGRFGLESDTYPVAGSGNTGGGTNGFEDCYLVAGCS
jgi:hypothetical protein